MFFLKLLLKQICRFCKNRLYAEIDFKVEFEKINFKVDFAEIDFKVDLKSISAST